MRKHFAVLAALVILMQLALTRAEAAGTSFRFESASGRPGQTVEMELVLDNTEAVTAIGLTGLEYDTDVLTFGGFSAYGAPARESIVGTRGFDDEKATVTLGYLNATAADGTICRLIFTIAEDAPDGEYPIRMSAKVKNGNQEISAVSPTGILTVVGGSGSAAQEPSHVHAMVHHASKAPSCFETGNVEYWSCSACGRYFLDPDGETEARSVSLPVDPERHTGETVVSKVVTPDETHDGYSGDVCCKGCGALLSKGEIIPKDAAPAEKPDEPADAPEETGAAWDNPFRDVDENDAYYRAVRFVYENGLFIGVSGTEFAPRLTMTRAMFVTVLGRLADVDVSLYPFTSFSDVKPGLWYSEYVEWAVENGIVLGYGDGRFGPDDLITTEQAALIICRYARLCGIDTSSDQALDAYPDAKDVSGWALEAVEWAVQNGIYVIEDGVLKPRSFASRATVAMMMYRFVSETQKQES